MNRMLETPEGRWSLVQNYNPLYGRTYFCQQLDMYVHLFPFDPRGSRPPGYVQLNPAWPPHAELLKEREPEERRRVEQAHASKTKDPNQPGTSRDF